MNKRVLEEVSKRGHEEVVYFFYPEVGLKAIIGIHDTTLGPALGGCRMRLYEDEGQALDDVLRLSEGMTYKSSLAGMDLGGGKGVLIVDPHIEKGRRELFLKFGECLNHLAGRYVSAEDMGTTVQDISWMREVSKYVVGFDPSEGGSGDPSPWTAQGVFEGILAACERVFGTKDLSKRHVVMQGVGHVGTYILEHLRKSGCKVTVSDVYEPCVRKAVERFDAIAVAPEKIYDIQCDVFSPNAIGQTINHETIKRLDCKIIAGAANNQLIDSTIYSAIEIKGIVYCPDFAINAGGVISVGAELWENGWNKKRVTEKVMAIGTTVGRVLDESKKRGRFPELVAIELAKERIASVKDRSIK
ncbi:MAG: Glu/Leu/Phe/Val dehydrogenase [SAR324 cluster bacterium]|uniref:Glu/Leu/Phe/Val dehydrogenase n=1 Tax=SAR324 cluster bacterium TaxID=2024889 RepID=A0A7X9FRC7_9DELT|nr:Glu/Leu/Phe/Val dehydrogenase [SAR324 cluster bacterium]